MRHTCTHVPACQARRAHTHAHARAHTQTLSAVTHCRRLLACPVASKGPPTYTHPTSSNKHRPVWLRCTRCVYQTTSETAADSHSTRTRGCGMTTRPAQHSNNSSRYIGNPPAYGSQPLSLLVHISEPSVTDSQSYTTCLTSLVGDKGNTKTCCSSCSRQQQHKQHTRTTLQNRYFRPSPATWAMPPQVSNQGAHTHTQGPTRAWYEQPCNLLTPTRMRTQLQQATAHAYRLLLLVLCLHDAPPSPNVHGNSSTVCNCASCPERHPVLAVYDSNTV